MGGDFHQRPELMQQELMPQQVEVHATAGLIVSGGRHAHYCCAGRWVLPQDAADSCRLPTCLLPACRLLSCVYHIMRMQCRTSLNSFYNPATSRVIVCEVVVFAWQDQPAGLVRPAQLDHLGAAAGWECMVGDIEMDGSH
jgi:hypothetical protein